MKRRLFIFIRLVVFFTIFFVILNVLSIIFTPKWKNGAHVNNSQAYTIRGFYELPKNSIDVLFLGNSSIYKSISPMQIYEDTGIVSYNYSISSARVYMFYYLLKDSLKYQSPKVVVVDPLTFFYQNKSTEPEKRKSFDYLKLGKTKLEMINDPVFENDTFEDKMSLIFPILRYHDRWSDLHLNDLNTVFLNYYSVSKGYIISDKIYPNEKGFDYMKKTKVNSKMKDYVFEYFVKLVNLCKENNIELVIAGIPDTRVWSYSNNEAIKEICEEYDVKYLDFNKEEVGIDWNTDTEDGGMHFNLLGAEKITKYMTKYLTDNYEFKDQRNNKDYSRWNEDLVKFNKVKEKYRESLEDKIKNKDYNFPKKKTKKKSIKGLDSY